MWRAQIRFRSRCVPLFGLTTILVRMAQGVSKSVAVANLDLRLVEVGDMRTIRNVSDPAFRRWEAAIKSDLRRVFGSDSDELLAFLQITFEPVEVEQLLSDSSCMHALQEGLEHAKALLSAWRGQVQAYWPSDAQTPLIPHEPTPLDIAVRVCERLHRVALRMRDRRSTRAPLVIADEYDVQYLLAGMLEIHFDDIEPEDPTPKIAGASSRIDFVLRPERIAIETKMTRDDLREKKLGEELIVDIARYQKHGGVDALICLVHDPERRIRNPRGLERDLEKLPSSLRLRVLVRG